jgi:flavin reductase (DIM6/NTAB) family NADH-FMN oxidoreductase RutF
MHKTIEPSILYFGTPMALISTMNLDGTANLAPMSSAWWLGFNGALVMSRTNSASLGSLQWSRYA